jgi:hypothetical protein
MKSPIHWVKLDITDFYRAVHRLPEDEIAEWVKSFAHALFFLEADHKFAGPLIAEALTERGKLSDAGKKGALSRWQKDGEIKQKNGVAIGDAIGDANGDAYGSNSNSNNNRNKERKQIQRRAPSADATGATPFSAFLSAYPRTEQRASAEKTWRKMPEGHRQKAIDGIASYLANCGKDKDGKTICYGLNNYLTNRCWEVVQPKQTATDLFRG